MNLRPLGDRILIKPEQQATVTASGLHLAEHWKPEQTGTVVSVGPCAHPLKADVLEIVERARCGISDDEADILRSTVAREPLVAEGDYVIFSWQVGQEIFLEDERYLLMREADILAVVDGV